MKIYNTHLRFFAIIYYRNQPLALQHIQFLIWQAYIFIYLFAGRLVPIAIFIFPPR